MADIACIGLLFAVYSLDTLHLWRSMSFSFMENLWPPIIAGRYEPNSKKNAPAHTARRIGDDSVFYSHPHSTLNCNQSKLGFVANAALVSTFSLFPVPVFGCLSKRRIDSATVSQLNVVPFSASTSSVRGKKDYSLTH